ncbi:hypothetical protein BSKO_02942 [Bryopsis sp. KO-2023]|nr:hypothetical protein BSKO_02942 [Bryopsis sp. KO-2023]
MKHRFLTRSHTWRGGAAFPARDRLASVNRPAERVSSSSRRRIFSAPYEAEASIGTDAGEARILNGNGAVREARRPQARSVVERLFDAINERELGDILNLLDDSCVHHDLAFREPHKGKKAATKFYLDLLYGTPKDMRFEIEDITGGDPSAAGLTWHIKVGGVEVPMSRGVSFYRVNSQGLITYVREGPEHFVKLGSGAVPMLAMGSPVIRRLAPLIPNPFQPGHLLPMSLESLQPPSSRIVDEVWEGNSASTRLVDETVELDETSNPHPPPIVDNTGPGNLAGMWEKDEEASDSDAYEEGMELLQLQSIQRVTARMICGLEIQQTEDTFSQHFILSTVVPQFRVTEKYKIGGTVEINRRDLRPGKTKVTFQCRGDTFVAKHFLGPSFPGKMVEVFRCPEEGVLELDATVLVGRKKARVLMVYRKKS